MFNDKILFYTKLYVADAPTLFVCQILALGLHGERVFDAVWRVLESPMAKTCAEVECSASAAIRRFVQTDAPHFSSVLAARYVPRFIDVLKNAPFRMRREVNKSFDNIEQLSRLCQTQ